MKRSVELLFCKNNWKHLVSLKDQIVGSNPTTLSADADSNLKVARLKQEGSKAQTIEGSKMNGSKEESPVVEAANVFTKVRFLRFSPRTCGASFLGGFIFFD